VANTARAAFKQPFTRRRGGHLSLSADEERFADAILEIPQLVAQRRLRQVQYVTGARQRAVLGECDDKLEMTDFQFHARY
jgi:hypothetical protein